MFIRTLRIESKMIFLDTQIRQNLGLEKANTDECLESMDQLLELDITALMLKKHWHVVETAKRVINLILSLKIVKF